MTEGQLSWWNMAGMALIILSWMLISMGFEWYGYWSDYFKKWFVRRVDKAVKK